MKLLSEFDKHLTPSSKLQWSILFLVCNSILIAMYFLGYDDVEIGSRQFYIGLTVCIVFIILGIALGRGLKVWYQK